MNGFSSFEVWFIGSIVVVLIILIVMAVFASRKIKGCELPETDLIFLIPHIDFLLLSRGWRTNVYFYKGKITVSKDSIVATDIYIRKSTEGKIEILYGSNAGTAGWVLLIVLVLFIGFIAAVVAIILHVYSRKFAIEEIIPMIMYYSHQGMIQHPQPIQPRAFPCSICGNQLRFISQYHKWYCDTCGKYV